MDADERTAGADDALRATGRDFWLLYTLSWLVFASAFAATHLLSGNKPLSASLAATALVVTPAAALGILVLGYAKMLHGSVENPMVRLAAHVFSAGAFAGLWVTSVWAFRLGLSAATSPDFSMFYPPPRVIQWHLLSGSMAYAMMIAVYHARTAQFERIKADKAAEVGLALSKFDPHFLFNTLGALRHLIKKDPVAADKAHSALAVLLREALTTDADSSHTLARELELAQAYLDLQSLRLGPRLKFSQEINESLLGAEVPALFLQPLLENAIQHGVERCELGGKVVLSVQRFGPSLRIRLENDQPVNNSSAGKRGLGLRIVEARVSHFANASRFKAMSNSDHFVVEISIPMTCGLEDPVE